MTWFGNRGDTAARLDDSSRVEPLPAVKSHVECIAVDRASREDGRLRQLIENHSNFVWRYLRRIGQCSADCDEIVQEACLVVSRRMDGIREGCERAYLLQVAVNVASTRRRSFSRELERIDQSTHSFSQEPTPDPEQAVAARQARRELEAILLAIPLDLRTVFVLYELEELGTREIAEMLDLKEGTVASRLRRARAEFRRLVQQRSQPPTAFRKAAQREGGEP